MATVSEAIRSHEQKQDAFNTRMGTSIDGIVGDVAGLNAIILELQNSPGQISAEDQAILDRLQAAGEALTTKAEAADAMTPPPVAVPVP